MVTCIYLYSESSRCGGLRSMHDVQTVHNSMVASSTVVSHRVILQPGSVSQNVLQGTALLVCSLCSCAIAGQCQGSTITGLEAARGAPDTAENCSCVDVGVSIRISNSLCMQILEEGVSARCLVLILAPLFCECTSPQTIIYTKRVKVHAPDHAGPIMSRH